MPDSTKQKYPSREEMESNPNVQKTLGQRVRQKVSHVFVGKKKRKSKPKDPLKIWGAMGKTSENILRKQPGRIQTTPKKSNHFSYKKTQKVRKHPTVTTKGIMLSHRGFVKSGKRTSKMYWEI